MFIGIKGVFIIYVTWALGEIYQQPKKLHDPPLAHTKMT